MRRAWRIGIIAGGLIYSLILWHQQSLTIAAGRKDQKEIVENAVDQSNRHSDQHSEGQTAELRRELREATTHSDGEIKTLSKTLDSTTTTVLGAFSKTAEDLHNSIEQVRPVQPGLDFRIF